MRRLIAHWGKTLREFVEQRDDLLLVVAASDADAPLLTKLLQELDRASPADLFFIAPDAAGAPAGYVEALAARLRGQVALANAAAADGDTLITAPPDFAAGPPAWRLQSMLEYLQTLVDLTAEQRFVCALVPEGVADAAGYEKLLAGLAPSPHVVGWMRGARVVARVPADFVLEGSRLAGAARVRFARLACPPDIYETELLADSADPAVPEADRMQSLVQLAYIDVAHGRGALADARFGQALAYFRWLKLPALEGLILNGLGDSARRAGDGATARRWYETALGPAGESGSPMLVAAVVQNLAAVAYAEGEFAEAADCYADVVTLRRGALDEEGISEALDWRGRSLEAGGDLAAALPCWEESAFVCREFEIGHRLGDVLGRLREGYARADLPAQHLAFERTWAAAGGRPA